MARTPYLRYVDPKKRRGRLYLAVARFSATKVGGWLSANIAWKIDPYLLRLTGGRLSTAWPLRAALLETRGARTGQPRRNATLYFHDGDRVTIIPSLRGWQRNPAWYSTSASIPTSSTVVCRSAPRSSRMKPSGNGYGNLLIASTRSTPPSVSRLGRLGGLSQSCSWFLASSTRVQSAQAG